MEKNKLRLFVLFSLVTVSSLFAQVNRYMIFLSDKENVPFTVDQPEDFLSQKAIDRRLKENFPITIQDLPVDSTYLQNLSDSGVEVYFASRWFNAALVQMEESLVSTVEDLPFVDSVTYIAAGAKLQRDQETVFIPQDFPSPDPASADTEFQNTLLGVDEMHEAGYLGEGMIIAVLDDGFLGVNQYKPFEHLFEQGQLLGARDFVGNTGNVFQYDDHGSASLSTIAAEYRDFVGTAPRADFLLCVTEDISKEYRIEEYNWLLAAEYADSAGADIISSSLGYSTFTDKTMDYEFSDLDGATAVVTRAAQLAAERGIVVVVSAGNEGSSSWKFVTAPADSRDILAVGSVTSAGGKSSFSSVGFTADGRIKPDVVALGEWVGIFTSNGSNGALSNNGRGTSFAAPQIAGFAAGVWQANPEWKRHEVINALKYSGSNATSPDSLVGYGIPSYTLAVQGVTLSAIDILDDKIKVYPNPFKEDLVQIDFGGIRVRGDLMISVIDMKGSEIYTKKISKKDLPDRIEINLSSSQKGVYFLKLESRKFNKTVKLIKI